MCVCKHAHHSCHCAYLDGSIAALFFISVLSAVTLHFVHHFPPFFLTPSLLHFPPAFPVFDNLIMGGQVPVDSSLSIGLLHSLWRNLGVFFFFLGGVLNLCLFLSYLLSFPLSPVSVSPLLPLPLSCSPLP